MSKGVEGVRKELISLRVDIARIEEMLGGLARQLGEWTTSTPERDYAGEFLTQPEAAEIAKVSTRTITRWVAEGKLHRYGAGRRVLIRHAELLARLDRDEPHEADVVDIATRITATHRDEKESST